MAAEEVPSHAEVVVVGGGVIGLSIAFQLAAAGVPAEAIHFEPSGA